MERLSPLDASFLDIEDDTNHMHIGSVAIFSGPAPSHDELSAAIAPKLDLVPRYRQRIRGVPLGINRPVWVDDPHFNLGYHLRHTALPAPGGEEEIRNLVGRIMAQQLDRTKPLWEIWLVEGVDGEHWALISKAHHAMVDGVSGTDLLAVLLDTEPEPAGTPSTLTPPAEAATPSGHEYTRSRWQPETEPSDLQLAVEGLTDFATPDLPLQVARTLVTAPAKAAGIASAAAKGLLHLRRVATPTPRSSIVGPIGPHRRWAWIRAELDDLKRIKQGLGGTINDVVLTAVAHGFRELLLSRREPVDGRSIRSMVPVSVRRPGEHTYNNRVSAMFADLPLGNDDPRVTLKLVSEELAGLKSSGQSVAAQVLTELGGFAPAMILSVGTRAATRVVGHMDRTVIDTVTTNIPGPQQPLYLLGSELLHAMPFVPLASPLRIATAIFSYNGELTFGVTADWETVPDLDDFTAGIEAALLELSYEASGT